MNFENIYMSYCIEFMISLSESITMEYLEPMQNMFFIHMCILNAYLCSVYIKLIPPVALCLLSLCVEHSCLYCKTSLTCSGTAVYTTSCTWYTRGYHKYLHPNFL